MPGTSSKNLPLSLFFSDAKSCATYFLSGSNIDNGWSTREVNLTTSFTKSSRPTTNTTVCRVSEPSQTAHVPLPNLGDTSICSVVSLRRAALGHFVVKVLNKPKRMHDTLLNHDVQPQHCSTGPAHSYLIILHLFGGMASCRGLPTFTILLDKVLASRFCGFISKGSIVQWAVCLSARFQARIAHDMIARDVKTNGWCCWSAAARSSKPSMKMPQWLTRQST